MKPSGKALGLVALLAGGIGIGAGVAADRWWHRADRQSAAQPGAGAPKPADEDEELEPAAVVRTVVAISGELPRTVDALGVAAIPSAATAIESWPSDLLISRVLVQPGQAVAQDAPMLQVAVT